MKNKTNQRKRNSENSHSSEVKAQKPRVKNKQVIKFEAHRPLGVQRKYNLGDYYLSRL